MSSQESVLTTTNKTFLRSKELPSRLTLPLKDVINGNSSQNLPHSIITQKIIREILTSDRGEHSLLISWSVKKFTKNGDNIVCCLLKLTVIAIVHGNNEILHYVVKFNDMSKIDPFGEFRKYSMKKEICFYKDILPMVNKELETHFQNQLKTPKFVYASMQNNMELLVLEDLSEDGYKMHNFRSGLTKDHLVLAVRELAKLHAAGYLIQDKMSQTKLKSKFPLLHELWFEKTSYMSKPFKTLFKDRISQSAETAQALDKHEASKWLKSISENCLDIIQDQIKSNSIKGTLCHGDTWNNNFLYRYDENGLPIDIRLIDFQICRLSSPATDLSYLFYTSVKTKADRDQHKIYVLKEYYKTLSKIINKPSFCFEKICSGVSNNLSGLILSLVYVPYVFSKMGKDINRAVEESNNKQYSKTKEDETIKQGELQDRLCDLFDDVKQLILS